MPQKPSPPAYCRAIKHGKPRGRAWIDGKWKWFPGEYDSVESREAYDDFRTKWLLEHGDDRFGMLVSELALLYLDFAERYFRKGGRLTSEFGCIKYALRFLPRQSRDSPVAQFGPRRLKEARAAMITAGKVRDSINRDVGRIRRMFRWGVENEYVPPAVLTALEAVQGLGAGRSEATEGDPVTPAPIADVEAVLSLVKSSIGGLVRFQLYTGARPGEAIRIRWCDVDDSGVTWFYRPSSHKTEHHGRERIVAIGPRGRDVLREFPTFDETEPIFPSRQGRPYTVHGYRCSIRRACEKAGVDVWTPNQLRHTFATEVRKSRGLEAAQVALGHARADVTQVYAERDLRLATEVAERLG